MYPIESETPSDSDNYLEVASGRVKLKINLQKIFKWFIIMVCLSFILILVIVMGFKYDGETKTLKQCLTGYYKFPDCISKQRTNFDMANRLNRYDHISPQSVIALLMVQFWIVMTMGTAFANTDLLVVNVISVKKDLRAANVMNVSQISLVTIAMNANQAISITHCVKVTNCFF